jgi:hypothetical protein
MLHIVKLEHAKEKVMMPVVRINDATFVDLSTLKTWFGTKSPSDTIDRIVREAMEQLGIERDDEVGGTIEVGLDGAMMFDTAPSLTFTKPLKATINGKPIQNPNWSTILHFMLGQIKAKGFDGEKLVQELAVPCKTAKYEEDGYRYYPELGISVQGQSAADAWKEVDRLSKKWRIFVIVEFIWRHNPKAQHPGKAGILRAGLGQ